MAVGCTVSGALIHSGRQAPQWKPPYVELPPPADSKPILDRLGGTETTIWLDHNVLTIAHKGASQLVAITGGIQMPMKKLAGTDISVLVLKMPDWQKAFFSYAFIPVDHPPRGRITFEKWYGTRAPARPKRVTDLTGLMEERTIHSDALSEDRKLTLYLPPMASTTAQTRNLPAFFLADGQSCRAFARVLEPLIEAGRVRPCEIVGVHSAQSTPGSDEDRRAEEYLTGYKQDVFDKHMRFFASEVPAYVYREFSISTRPEDHAVIGFSNAGGFAFDAATEHPEVFGCSLPFSPSHGLKRRDKPSTGSLPVFYVAGGELEYFGVGARQCYEDVSRWPGRATLKMYRAGHDPEMWEMAFADYALEVFPIR
jgi:enterochelin esterase-like enzyme